MKTKPNNLIRDFWIVVFSVIIAVLLAKTGAIESFLVATSETRIGGSFIAGMFFTSMFTAAPAVVALSEISLKSSPFLVGFFGALGALLGDYVIFHFVKDSITRDLLALVKQHRRQRWTSIFRLKLFRWVLPFFGAIVIASPLPDELGLAMLGLSNISVKHFAIISFSLNFIGILAISLIVKGIA